MSRRYVVRVSGAILSALLLFILISDWPTGLLADFWLGHPILTNFLTSALFLLIGATFVERWLARQEDARYLVIEATAFGAVARCPLAIRRTLWFLLHAGNMRDDSDFGISEHERQTVREILARHNLAYVDESAVGRGEIETPSDVSRLKVLMQDPEWRNLAHVLVRRALHASRLVVGRWAQLLMTSRRSALALNDLSALLEDLRDIRDPLNTDHYPRGFSNEEGQVRFLEAWRRCFVNASVTYEDFALAARTLLADRWSTRLVQPADRVILQSSLSLHAESKSFVGRLYDREIGPTDVRALFDEV
ncbi:hypothetical protein [Actinomycetospora lemnae]|uniref:Uncharacterized protein n=1 Tax=Actinomycetospora lemnae TaxID=3019891 RepID=A0ABT5SZZ1_9PSEU|nr:hypothetical protein [Actinomycetospora sp. DW7H6]MDD7968428.1 hypothetical protein [Actinomycetospora sp. DW7H6]